MLNATESVYGPELVAKIAAAIIIYQQEFPDAQADVSWPCYSENGCNSLFLDEVLDISFNQPFGTSNVEINIQLSPLLEDRIYDFRPLCKPYQLLVVVVNCFTEQPYDQNRSIYIYATGSEENVWEECLPSYAERYVDKFERVAQNIYNLFKDVKLHPELMRKRNY
jgi:hypothetical protein